MSVREKMAAQQTVQYLDVFHPAVGHVAIRSLSEYQRSCLENSLSSDSRNKKAGVTKDKWLLSARAKMLMFVMCEPEFLYAEDGSTSPNPDAFKPVYTTVHNIQDGTVIFDKDQLKEILNTNGAITGAFSEPAMKHVGMTPQDFEELLGNSEATSANVS